MIRFIHADRMGKKSGLGHFRLKGDPQQAQAALNIYHLFIRTKGCPDISDLQRSRHRLLDTLLRPRTVSEDVIGYPTDQMLFLSSLLTGGRYRIAGCLASTCAKLQFCFCSILVHVARLSAEHLDDYVPFSVSGSPGSTEPPESTSESSADAIQGLSDSATELNLQLDNLYQDDISDDEDSDEDGDGDEDSDEDESSGEANNPDDESLSRGDKQLGVSRHALIQSKILTN